LEPRDDQRLENSELAFGLDLLHTNHSVSSSVLGFSGSTDAEPGIFPIPNIGWVHRDPESIVTWGLGLNAVAGFKTNLPADPTNPMLAPPPFGLGRVTSEATFLQLAPVASVALTDQLSFGIGPTITMGQVGIEPFVFDSRNADGMYSPGRASRYHWGGGIQAGIYYVHNCDWHFGTSVKSQTWMEEFRFFGADALGGSRILHADVNLPLVVSAGTAYTGMENWVFALDVRYFDYKNTDGFGDAAVFDADGKLNGLDWSSVFAMALGVQRRITNQFALRAGYTFNQSPIKDSETLYNIASPLIYEHMLSLGASWDLSPVWLSMSPIRTCWKRRGRGR
jgi:long-chain fatty acid transport protein